MVVGTYRPENEAWIAARRLYNLPLPKCGKLAFHEAVVGIVLFAEGHRNFAFKARFKDVVDGAWLKKNGYDRTGGTGEAGGTGETGACPASPASLARHPRFQKGAFSR